MQISFPLLASSIIFWHAEKRQCAPIQLVKIEVPSLASWRVAVLIRLLSLCFHCFATSLEPINNHNANQALHIHEHKSRKRHHRNHWRMYTTPYAMQWCQLFFAKNPTLARDISYMSLHQTWKSLHLSLSGKKKKNYAKCATGFMQTNTKCSGKGGLRTVIGCVKISQMCT